MPGTDVESRKAKSTQLFNFIREFATLTRRPVESLDSYTKTFWLDQIPNEPECSFFAWANSDETEGELVVENWLTVERPERQDPPPVEEELKPWVDVPKWRDSSNEMPELLPKIINPNWSEDVTDSEPQFHELRDYPEIQATWDDYIQEEWWPWAEIDRRKARVQECYNELFVMHRTQLSVGDQYEFLLGVGCLHWNTPSGGNVKRHLLVLPVTVDFDFVRAIVAVKSTGSFPEVQLENDMLTVHDRPPHDIQEDVEARRGFLGENIFHTQAKTLLKAYVQGLDSEGAFIDRLARVNGKPAQKPTVAFAPALIVRRRTSRNLISVCQGIIKQLQDMEDEEMPAGVRKVVGELGVDKEVFVKKQEKAQSRHDMDHEIYFPLPYNDEQRDILNRLTRQVGVLVQGPPGTGKSQTIANLICHLLATGERILVTSQKAPALRVLKDKLPSEIADLCVMVLGEGPDEKQELRRSVNEVANRHTNWSLRESEVRIQELQDKLSRARETKAKAFETLCAVRERETFSHSNIFGGYGGTLGEIAEQVRKDSETFCWFKDELPESVDLINSLPPECPIKKDVAIRFLKLLRQIDPTQETRSRPYLVSLSEIPSIEDFKTFVRDEKEAEKYFEERKHYLDHPAHNAFLNMETADLSDLLDNLDEFLQHLLAVKNTASDLDNRIAKEILNGNMQSYKSLQEASGDLLDYIEKQAAGVEDLEVAGLGGRPYRVMLREAKQLKEHFEQGGRRGFWCFRPAVVKQSLYLLREVTIDGQTCGSIESLSKFIKWLQLQDAIKKLEEQWAPLNTLDISQYPLNQIIAKYKQFQARLDEIIAIGDRAEALERRMEKYDRSRPKVWNDVESVRNLRDMVEAILAQRKLQEVRSEIDEAEFVVNEFCYKTHTAPENYHIRAAIRDRNIDNYARVYKQLEQLWECRHACQERDQLRSEMAKALPKLLKSMEASYKDEKWDHRLYKLNDAWQWLCADRWLSQMADPSLEDSLTQKVEKARQDASHALTRLAAEKAWKSCMESMTESNFQSLMAWRKAIDRVGKGTGKYVERNRRLAKERLEECRGAIPAWVMPLYKVLDTVDVHPGIFDVAIIDEASQSGPEALFLSFIAKQIVVVGDDQQIRPENVGVDQGEVHQLQQFYLRDINNWEIFGATESLFSISEVRFGNQVRLREHFRCMPEIIAFSNRLCYQDQPLIPLRQFGRDRLTPVLKRNYVPGAYQEKGNKVNLKEAEAVAASVEECCNDPAYAGKSFGIISLLHSSEQAKYIEKLLIKRLDAEEIEKRNIVCGDAYDFQGDERDIIFLTMVSARSDQTRIATMSDEKAKRRFNVAVSRARDQVLLFHSIEESELGQNCFRRRLLSHFKEPQIDPIGAQPWDIAELYRASRNNPRRRGNQPSPFDSWFEVDVFLAIAGQGYLAIPQYEIHGYRIDIVVIGTVLQVAVECDGDQWHGPEKYAEDLHRQSQLERCGWNFFRIRSSRFYRDPDSALFPLWAMIEEQEEPNNVEEPAADSEEKGPK